MNITEANATYTLLRAVFLDLDPTRPGPDSDKMEQAVVLLADRAHAALNAGPSGADIRRWLDQPAAAEPEQACRACGCTDGRACVCHWVEPDLCSSCAIPSADRIAAETLDAAAAEMTLPGPRSSRHAGPGDDEILGYQHAEEDAASWLQQRATTIRAAAADA